MPARLCSKSFRLGLQHDVNPDVNRELIDVQTGFRTGRWTRDKIANTLWITEKAREFPPPKKIYCFIDYAKASDCVDHNKVWNILNEMGIPDHITCLLRNLYAGQAAAELDMEQQTGSKLGKEYKSVYCHPVYLTYVKSTSSKMLSWMNHKLESRLPGEISTASDLQMTPL